MSPDYTPACRFPAEDSSAKNESNCSYVTMDTLYLQQGLIFGSLCLFEGYNQPQIH